MAFGSQREKNDPRAEKLMRSPYAFYVRIGLNAMASEA
jgi:hypothetical protein